MTKLKGWKIKQRTKHGEVFYKSKDTKREIWVFKKGELFAPFVWRVGVSNKEGYFHKGSIGKKFKKKSQALKFAKSYMKKHPRG